MNEHQQNDRPSLRKLNAQLETLQAQIAEVKKEEAKATKTEVLELIKERGFSFEDLFPNDGKKKRSPVEPKYRNPDNEELTWSGRGRKPKWLVEALEEGKKLDSFLILK